MNERREAWARLTADDQHRVAVAAAAMGVSGLTLTVWLLALELGGGTVEDSLHTAMLAHRCRLQPGWDPTVRVADGIGPHTVCAVPAVVWDGPPITLPPVPGIATATRIVTARPALDGERRVLDVG